MSSSTATGARVDAFVLGTHELVRHLTLLVDVAIGMAEAGDVDAARRGLHQVEGEMFAAIAALPGNGTDGAVAESLFCAMSSWIPGLDHLAHLADELGAHAA